MILFLSRGSGITRSLTSDGLGQAVKGVDVLPASRSTDLRRMAQVLFKSPDGHRDHIDEYLFQTNRRRGVPQFWFENLLAQTDFVGRRRLLRSKEQAATAPAGTPLRDGAEHEAVGAQARCRGAR